MSLHHPLNRHDSEVEMITETLEMVTFLSGGKEDCPKEQNYFE